MRKETLKSISWIVVSLILISALGVMWICPGIIAKIIVTVAVIASLLSAMVEDLNE